MRGLGPRDLSSILRFSTIYIMNKIYRMTPLGRRWLSALEGGPILDAYQDNKGVWTIGVGSTYWPDTGLPVVRGDKIATPSIADSLFTQVLGEFEDHVSECLEKAPQRNGAPYPLHVTDALISFCFNIGKAGFSTSTALKRFRENYPMTSVATAMSWWKNPDLKSRRRAETDCLLHGRYADQSGRLTR